MKHTPKEILYALNVIKSECAGQEMCINCPLSYKEINAEGFCKLHETVPSQWDIVSEEPELWRAFK